MDNTLGSFGGIWMQAIAKGLKDPSFRVIQNHFAVSENVGDVAAKVHFLNFCTSYHFTGFHKCAPLQVFSGPTQTCIWSEVCHMTTILSGPRSICLLHLAKQRSTCDIQYIEV